MAARFFVGLVYKFNQKFGKIEDVIGIALSVLTPQGQSGNSRAQLGDLVTNQRKIFLSRPRRMGKSLLISSLKNLFTYGDKNFEGTAIYGNWPYSKSYPVIHLSFNQVEGTDAQSYAQSLKGAITEAYRAAGFYQVEEYEQEDLTLNRFLNKVGRISDETRLVFLVDEWDYALSSNLNNATLFNDVLSVLKTFYSWLRGIDSTRFILITGIMRYNSVSLFSGQDIQDISMEPINCRIKIIL